MKTQVELSVRLNQAMMLGLTLELLNDWAATWISESGFETTRLQQPHKKNLPSHLALQLV